MRKWIVYLLTALFLAVSCVSEFEQEGSAVDDSLEGAPVTVEKKSDLVYELPCSVTLDENLSLFQVLSLLKNMDFEGCVVDLSALVTLKNGLKKKLEYNDIPVKDLMKNGAGTLKI